MSKEEILKKRFEKYISPATMTGVKVDNSSIVDKSNHVIV